MLLATVVEELEREQAASSGTVLSYFFCQATDEKLNNATGVLRGLIYLLCTQQPWLASHLHDRYDASVALLADANTFHVLAKSLKSIIHDNRLQKVYLVVDALDECVVDRDRDQLLRLIAEYIVASPHVKWILSSRNTSNIENALAICSTTDSEIRLNLEVTQSATQISQAVEAFIDHKLSAIASLGDKHNIRKYLQQVMREKANGTFLWVALVAKEIEKAPTWEMRKLITKLPSSLEDFYAVMMDRARCDSLDTTWEYCRLVLSASALAYRPLSLVELAIVSGLPQDIFANDPSSVRELVGLCGSFLTVKDDVVYLLHQSVQDFLRSRAVNTIFLPSIEQSHRNIFARSVDALSTCLRRNIYGLQHPGVQIDEVRVPGNDPLASIRYSCIYWARHLCDASSGRGGFANDDFERTDRIIRNRFLYWLEAASLLRGISESILWLRNLERLLKVDFFGRIRIP